MKHLWQWYLSIDLSTLYCYKDNSWYKLQNKLFGVCTPRFGFASEILLDTPGLDDLIPTTIQMRHDDLICEGCTNITDEIPLNRETHQYKEWLNFSLSQSDEIIGLLTDIHNGVAIGISNGSYSPLYEVGADA